MRSIPPGSSRFVWFILLFSPLVMQGQTSGTGEKNFYELQAEMNEKFAAKPGTREEKQWRRFESFYEPRVFPDGNLEHYDLARQQAIRYLERTVPAHSRSTHGDWGFLGPSQNLFANFGRCVRIHFHPTDTAVLFVLTTSGGLWKTMDYGSTWTNLTPDLPYLFCSDFVINPENPDSIFILTSNAKQYQHQISGTQGIYMTDNGGETWTIRNPFPTMAIGYRLVMHPDDPAMMFAGMSTGIYRTTNAWETSSLASFTLTSVFDIEFKPDDPSIMYLSTDKRIAKSAANGDPGSWMIITDPVLAFQDSMLRCEIGVTPDHPNCIYLAGSNLDGDFIVRSLNDGDPGSWEMRDSVTDIWFLNPPEYNMGIEVDPEDYNRIFVMAIGLLRSENGGQTGSWFDCPAVHVDHHDVAFHGSGIFDLNDGGLGYSVDGGTTWTHKTSGIEVFEAYAVGGTPQDPTRLYTGAQDAGANRIGIAGEFQSVCFGCTGDVVKCLIDYTDPDRSYLVPWLGGLRYTYDNWQTFEDTGSGGSNFEPEFGKGIFLCPYEMDPVVPHFIFTGKDSMWRLDMNAQTAQPLGDPGPNKVKRIAQGTDNRNRMCVITGGRMFRTDSALTTSPAGAPWTEIENDLVMNGFETDIITNPLNADQIFVTYGGTVAGQKVYYSYNRGEPGTWQNLSGSLPNIPVITIEFHDNGLGNKALYIGTDIGVFYRDNDLGDWVYFGNRLPAVPVSELYINTVSNEIVAATLGRGVWKSDLYTGCINHLLLPAGIDTGGQRHYSVHQTLSSFREYDPSQGTHIIYQAGEFVDMKPGFRITVPGFFHAKTGDCPVIYVED